MTSGEWDIFGNLACLRRELGRLESAAPAGPAPAEHTWCPAVDIYERDDALVLLVDLPGVGKQHIDLRLDADVLTLEGLRHRPIEAVGVRWERPFGRFTRSFRIGLPVAAEGVRATYQDGVLEIVLPKADRQEAARVRVAVE
jgi:HSP20 family protein